MTKITSPMPTRCVFNFISGDAEDNSGDALGHYLSRRAALKTLSDDFVNTLETETRKLKRAVSHDVKQILREQETLGLELESKKQQLNCRNKELDEPMFHEATFLQKDAEEKCWRLIERLKEKEEEISELERVHQDLLIKECQTNDEMQDARKKLIKNVLKEDDGLLRGLVVEWGKEIYDAVVATLWDLQEYNPSGCNAVRELWNFVENSKATLGEAISSGKLENSFRWFH